MHNIQSLAAAFLSAYHRVAGPDDRGYSDVEKSYKHHSSTATSFQEYNGVVLADFRVDNSEYTPLGSTCTTDGSSNFDNVSYDGVTMR